MTTKAARAPSPAFSPARLITLPQLARLGAFVPLCLLGLLGWSTLLENAPAGTPWAMTACAASVAAALAAMPAGVAARRRHATLAGAAVLLVTSALLSAGVPAEMLWPRRWDEGVAGVADGLIAIPGISSPYRGDDFWVRTTVLLGGTLLAGIAALQAFWPRPGSSPRSSPVPAAMSLTMLYGVAVIEVPPSQPFVSGAVFAVLLAGFLFADRVRPAQAAPAVVCVVVATLLAATLAPLVDADRPWFDLERISEDVANTGTVGYQWNHDYGPLDWPRDGRELLRIKAQAGAYWKAQSLDAFDGRAWRRSGLMPTFESDGETDPGHPEWLQQIEVSVKGLRSEQFVTAGQTLEVVGETRKAVRVAGGTFVTERGILRRGARYSASVYTPDPNEGELGRAGTAYPNEALPWLSVEIPAARGAARSGRPGRRAAVRFAPFGSGQADTVASAEGGIPGSDAAAAIEGSGLERIYALARRLRSQVDEPYAYVEAVLARVRRGATYTEQPAPAENPLDRFLFDAPRGYCQHFSGAMALLLRMGGVPARVAVGFTPGRQDAKTGEYVVRDLDAHSWVEAYFPRLGWVTFDPTPAAAPPREQSADLELALGVRRGTDGSQGDRQGDPTAGGVAAAGSDSSLPVIAGALAAVLAALVSWLMLWRRRRPVPAACAPELRELERALLICGRPAPAGATLTDLESRLGGTDDARGYLRALSMQRFGPSGHGPTEAQRSALRRELASGLGRAGRLRSWIALPPRLLRR